MTWNVDNSAERFQSHLRTDERLVWSGQPDPKVFVNATDFIFTYTAFSLLVFTIGGGFMATGFTFPPSLSSTDFILLALAAYLGLGRLFVRRRRKRKVWYAVSNQRAMIVNETDGLRFIELKDFIHDSRVAKNGNSIAVNFRSPTSPATGRAGYFDLYLEGMPTFLLARARQSYQVTSAGSNANINPNAVVFIDVTDVTGLLNALSSAPEAS